MSFVCTVFTELLLNRRHEIGKICQRLPGILQSVQAFDRFETIASKREPFDARTEQSQLLLLSVLCA